MLNNTLWEDNNYIQSSPSSKSVNSWSTMYGESQWVKGIGAAQIELFKTTVTVLLFETKDYNKYSTMENNARTAKFVYRKTWTNTLSEQLGIGLVNA